MPNTVHNKIKQLRKDLGLTQENMAEYLCISQNAYSLIENGKTKIDIERLYKITNKLNIRLTDLIKSDDNQNQISYNNDVVIALREVLVEKDKQIQQLLQQNFLLLGQLEKIDSHK